MSKLKSLKLIDEDANNGSFLRVRDIEGDILVYIKEVVDASEPNRAIVELNKKQLIELRDHLNKVIENVQE